MIVWMMHCLGYMSRVCVSASYLSPIRYRPGELRENNNLSTGLKRHGEQSTLGVPAVP